MKRLAIVTTHPIQYYAPLFRLLHERGVIDIKVFYTWGKASDEKFDPGFKKIISWDIPLLEGYPYEWVNNTSKEPGSHHFNGIVNPSLTDQIGQYQPDAVLFFGWAYQSHLKAMRFFKGKVPVYFRGDSTLLDEKPGPKQLLRSFYLKWIYKNIDHAFYCGTNNKAYFKKYGLTELQLSLTPHAVENERFMIDRSGEAAVLKKNLGIGADDLIILFAGKLEEKKDPLTLFEAFSKLSRTNCQLLFVGNGELESELKRRALNTANIHFLDFQNQSYMPVVLQACSLFCLPSKGPGETWGLVVNEAMASGKPVIISDKTGCGSDLVRENFNGAIFPAGDTRALTQIIDRLLQSAGGVKKMGENSLTLVKDWNFTKIAEAIENKLNAEPV